MQNETASTEFLRFGAVYKSSVSTKSSELICQTKHITAQRFASLFQVFDCDVFLEVESGIGVLLVSDDPVHEPIFEFGMNRRIMIKANVYFAFVTATTELVLKLYASPQYSMEVLSPPAPYEFRPVLPMIQIRDILGYYYRIRTPGYSFVGEKHPFFELTYIDTGTMHTQVDGVPYTLHEKELIIYGPGQFHNQYTDDDQSVSYVTIMFNMENLSLDIQSGWYAALINKVFPYDKKIYTLIKTLVRESTTGAPYMDNLMLCLLTETVIRLLQGEYITSYMQPSSVVRQNYQDELFDRINAYIEANICEPLTIAEICQQFSLSRSSLQLLFKNAVNQSPKKYISDLKLEKSCQMLRENKYTISEISLKLGYSSIHYFSNAFNQRYHISPSEYAKRIY